jgi:Skp family chaperone for outer membrane proteins
MKRNAIVVVILTLALFVLLIDTRFSIRDARCASDEKPRLPVGQGAASIESTKDKCLKIGVVSVRKIFQDCKHMAKYRQEFTAEGDKMKAELEKLTQEIKDDKSGLETLKTGTPDYLSAVKEMLEKQGNLQAKQEYFKQLMDMRQQTIFEQLFKDVVKATVEVAKEKGLDLVLEKSEPELPGEISTQKVLYSAGCEDITEAVLAKVDANSP